MKNIIKRKWIVLIYLLGIVNVFAVPGPPAPTYKVPPPPPGTPIDENLIILFFIALLFGVYIIYRENTKSKTPI